MDRRLTPVLIALAAVLAACSENTVAPRSEATVDTVAAPQGGATAALTSWDTVRFSFTIDPSRQTYYNLGAGNSINFPAHSLCDIDRSSYGPTEWDKPCKEARKPLTVNAKAWIDKAGHARIDFDKHIRFVPSSDPADWVVLTFADFQASLDPFFNILYCPEITGPCYNEAMTDPSLLTFRNPSTGQVMRRIKHFSGYNVTAGMDDGSSMMNMMPRDGGLSVSASDLSLDDLESVARAHPSLTANQVKALLGDIRAARRSGYILASG